MIISNSLPCSIFKGPFLITQGYMDTDLLFSLKATDKPPTKELRWIITTARKDYETDPEKFIKDHIPQED